MYKPCMYVMQGFFVSNYLLRGLDNKDNVLQLINDKKVTVKFNYYNYPLIVAALYSIFRSVPLAFSSFESACQPWDACPIVMIHGLLGAKRNLEWVAKRISEDGPKVTD